MCSNTTVNGDMKVYAVWKKNLNEVPLNASGNVYAKLDSAKNVNISAKNTSGDMKIEYFKWHAMKLASASQDGRSGPLGPSGAPSSDTTMETGAGTSEEKSTEILENMVLYKDDIYSEWRRQIGRASCRERV